MAMQSKARLLTDIHTLLKRRYKPKPDRDSARLTVLTAVIYGICHEDTTREQANQALSRFNDEFLDWNEVRVSSVLEIQEALAGLPDPEEKAKRIRRFLRQLFARTYGFTLEPLVKKPLKDALKVLKTYEAFDSDFVTATVVQQALGGHAIPIDKPSQRVLARLGMGESDPASLRAIVERAVPKNRGVEFAELIEDLANDVCKLETPECPRCDLRKHCDYAKLQTTERTATARAAVKSAAESAKAQAQAAAKPAKKPATAKGKPPAKSTPAPKQAAPAAKSPPPAQVKKPTPPAAKKAAAKSPPKKPGKHK